MHQTILPVQKLEGEVELPGDKSISHRALIISAIAEGQSQIENMCNGLDVRSTATCLKNLGVKITEHDNQTIVNGVGLHGLRKSKQTLDVGNSATTMRLLSGVLAGQKFESKLTGDDSLRRRSMSRIIEPLSKMGASISAIDNEYAPLSIAGNDLANIEYRMPIASAQVKSAILLAGLFASGKTVVQEPIVTRDHSELLLSKFGASIERYDNCISIEGGHALEAKDVFVPGDISSAAFFITAAMLVKDSGVLVRNVGINPTRRTLISLLSDMGANLDILNIRTLDNEMMADLFIKSSELVGVKIGGAIVPRLIDEIPILAVLATQAEGTTEILDASELRNKESDRLRSLKFNLDRMGANVTERDDGLIIKGPTQLQAADVESFDDHRIAMTFAVAGLVANGETKIKNSSCVNVSFPDFFETLQKLSAGP